MQPLTHHQILALVAPFSGRVPSLSGRAAHPGSAAARASGGFVEVLGNALQHADDDALVIGANT